MTISYEKISAFEEEMIREEAASSTIKRYTGILREFALYLGKKEISKEILLEWRDGLDVCPATANVAAAAMNRFLAFLGLQGMKLKYRKVQRSVFRPAEKELTKEDYSSLSEGQSRIKTQDLPGPWRRSALSGSGSASSDSLRQKP